MNWVFTPKSEEWRELSATSPACNKALVGMQPRCKHVPPSLFSSIKATLKPSWDERRAQAYPPLPPPRITTSNCDTKRLSLITAYYPGNLSLILPRNPSEPNSRAIVYLRERGACDEADSIRVTRDLSAIPVPPTGVYPCAVASL